MVRLTRRPGRVGKKNTSTLGSRNNHRSQPRMRFRLRVGVQAEQFSNSAVCHHTAASFITPVSQGYFAPHSHSHHIRPLEVGGVAEAPAPPLPGRGQPDVRVADENNRQQRETEQDLLVPLQ